MKKGKRLIKFILLLIVLIALLNIKTVLRRVYPADYAHYVAAYSAEYNVDPYLVYSVIKAESNFVVDAISHRDAMGLMQITPDTGQWISENIGLEDFTREKLLNPEINIRMGCWYLNNLTNQFNGNIDLALAAYNGGSGNVEKWLKNKEYSQDGKTLSYIPFAETDEYVKKVKVNYNIYQRLYDN